MELFHYCILNNPSLPYLREIFLPMKNILICLLEKVFSFLSQDEVERMRAEEDQKIASLSRSEIKSWADIDEADDDDDVETKYLPNLIVSSIIS